MNRLQNLSVRRLLTPIVLFIKIAIITSCTNLVYAEMITPSQMVGTWYGIYQCSNYPATFELVVQSNGGNQLNAQLTRKQYRSNGKPFNPANLPDAHLNGQLSSDQGTFILSDAGAQAAATRNSNVSFYGVLNPKTNQFAAHIKVPRETNCSYAIAGKNEFKNTVDDILKKVPPLNVSLAVGAVKTCDKNVADWLQQSTVKPMRGIPRSALRYGELELFQDEKFKPFFDKSFLDLGAEEFKSLHAQVASPCWQIASDAGMGGVLKVIRSQPRADLMIYGHSKGIVKQWRSQVLNSFASQPAQSKNELLRSTEDLLTILWPIQESDIKAELAQQQFKNNNKSMMTALEKKMQTTSHDFTGLLALANFGERILVGDADNAPTAASASVASPMADPVGRRMSRREMMLQERLQRRQYAGTNTTTRTAQTRVDANAFYVEAAAQQQAHEKIRRVINDHIRAASATYLSGISEPGAAQLQLQKISAGPNAVLSKYLDSQNAVWLDQQIAARRSQLLVEFAARESKHFENKIRAKNKNLMALKQSMAYELSLSTRYGDMLSAAEFTEFNQKRASYRRQLIDDNSQALAQQIRSAASLPALDSMVSSYLQSDELGFPQAAPLQLAIKETRQILAPFEGYPAADFLNAVYANDTSKVRTINQQYIDRMQRSISQFLGRGDFRTAQLNSLADHISLMTPMAATYLFAYDRHYEKCLRDDATEFTVTTSSPGSVTTNLLGVEVARTYGYSNTTHYRVNTEFTDVFQKIGTTNSGGMSAMLVDKLLSDGSVAEIRRGVGKIMSDFECDSDVIKKLEIAMRYQFNRN